MYKTLLRLPSVSQKTGLAKATLYKLMQDGNFPKPVKQGRISLWVESEINNWIDERISVREQNLNAAEQGENYGQ